MLAWCLNQLILSFQVQESPMGTFDLEAASLPIQFFDYGLRKQQKMCQARGPYTPIEDPD